MASLSRDEYERRHKRLIMAVVAQFVILVLAVGVIASLYSGVQHSRCQELRERTVTAADLLPKIVAAAEKDGATHQAAFWKGYLSKVPSIPKC